MGLVLFICVENRFRSQIAEAYFNKYAPSGWRAISAGLKPAIEVHPNAVKLMLEEGIDISHKKPQILTDEMRKTADIVVLACSGACPIVHSGHVEKWGIPDPAEMPIEEARRIRDEIKTRVLGLIERLKLEG
ncbi:arsenate reductase ArsC [Candidatus Bathyarchaeota archaeon]|nr:arsenate reductase ArsC [Candidatus Bathyarchaeota archaeon]